MQSESAALHTENRSPGQTTAPSPVPAPCVCQSPTKLLSERSRIGREDRSPLVSNNFRIIGRDRYSHQFELIVVIDPKRPGETFPTQIQAQKLPVRTADVHFFLAHQLEPDSHGSAILRHQNAEFHGSLLALQISTLRVAVRSQVTPQEHLTMNEEIVVQDHGRVGHQEWLFRGFGGGGSGNFLNEKFVAWSDDQRTHGRGRFVPLVANQLRIGHDLQFRALIVVSRAASVFKMRLDDAEATLLLDAEALRYDPLSFYENTERT